MGVPSQIEKDKVCSQISFLTLQKHNQSYMLKVTMPTATLPWINIKVMKHCCHVYELKKNHKCIWILQHVRTVSCGRVFWESWIFHGHTLLCKFWQNKRYLFDGPKIIIGLGFDIIWVFFNPYFVFSVRGVFNNCVDYTVVFSLCVRT